MSRRRWTVMILPDDHASPRQFRVSQEFIRLAIALALVVVSVLGSLAVGFFVKEGHRLRAERLTKEKRLLVAELEGIRSEFGELKSALEDLSRRDDHYRLLAKLNPIDEEVRQVGIGGPGTPVLETNPLWRQNGQLGELTFATAYDLNAMLRRARLLTSSWHEATESIVTTHDSLATLPSVWPVEEGWYLSSGFSSRRLHPISHRYLPHEGIDISAPRGTPIVATARGRVLSARGNGGYGLMVEVDHGNGVVTRYAHVHQYFVRPGQVVERGQKIAEVGSTGLATGPHLHYEVLVNGVPRNPMTYIFDWDAILD